VSGTFPKIQELVAEGRVRLSEHALSRLLKHGVKYRDVLAGAVDAIVVEDYPDYVHGPAVLVLQKDRDDMPVHALWGLPASGEQLAFVITVYRPDHRWSPDKLRRVTR
jgi:Domain of unknown function (DUF4258)